MACSLITHTTEYNDLPLVQMTEMTDKIVRKTCCFNTNIFEYTYMCHSKKSRKLCIMIHGEKFSKLSPILTRKLSNKGSNLFQ